MIQKYNDSTLEITKQVLNSCTCKGKDNLIMVDNGDEIIS